MFRLYVRGAGGDEWVGVPSIFGSGARARVIFFIFYFCHHGHAPYHSTKKREGIWANSGARADPIVQAHTFCSSHHQWGLYLLCKAHPPSLAHHPRPLLYPVSKPTTRRTLPFDLGVNGLRKFGCARARFIFYFIFFPNGMPPNSIPCRYKKKVAAGKPGARAHPNPFITPPFPNLVRGQARELAPRATNNNLWPTKGSPTRRESKTTPCIVSVGFPTWGDV